MHVLSRWDHFYNYIVLCLKDAVNPITFIIMTIVSISAIVAGCLRLIASLSITGLEIRTLSSEDTKKYQRVAYGSTQTDSSGKKSGFIFGKWFVGRVIPSTSRHTMLQAEVIVSRGTHDRIVSGKSTKNRVQVEPPTSFDYYFIESHRVWNTDYTKREAKICSKSPHSFQSVIVNSIIDFYHENDGVAVVLISGPPGCGKSSVCEQLIRYFAEKKQSVSFCNDFCFTKSGYWWESLWNSRESEMKPMIVLVDEIDGSLNLIKTNSVEKDKNHRLTAHDKASWNRFFDAVERKTYKNLILVMTTNLTLDQIDEGDTALTRPGRVNLRFEVDRDRNVKQQSGTDGRWVY